MSTYTYELIGRYATYLGLTLLACLVVVIICIVSDWTLDRVIKSLRLQREVLAFFWERANKRRRDKP